MTDADIPCDSTEKNPTIIFLISPFLSTRDLVRLWRTCMEFGLAQETEDQQISLINRAADYLFLNEANCNEMRALPCNISQSYILRLHHLILMHQFVQEVAPQRGAIHFHHAISPIGGGPLSEIKYIMKHCLPHMQQNTYTSQQGNCPRSHSM